MGWIALSLFVLAAAAELLCRFTDNIVPRAHAEAFGFSTWLAARGLFVLALGALLIFIVRRFG